MLDVVLSISLLSLVSYGEVEDGQPSYDQRELHTYTNLIRVDPLHWEADYGCETTDWTDNERTSQSPLYYHEGLTEIAQMHTDEMADDDGLVHDSADGTPWEERVLPYYEGEIIGENVADGYESAWETLVLGWMCSTTGHRMNMMQPGFEDLGTGIKESYYTQDFGGGADTMPYSVAMGVHTPEFPEELVTFYTTWNDFEAPVLLAVELRDACVEMTRFAGTENQGAWSLETEAESGCVPYRFYYEKADGDDGTLPENGSYQYGEDCELWVAEASEVCMRPSPCGCAASGTASGWSILLLGLPLLTRRRRSRADD